MEFVGRIDREIYRCVRSDIPMDEVIITDERIAHIRERHPGDYERYSRYLQNMVEFPQYIIRDDDPNVAILLKRYTVEREQFRLVLSFCIVNDSDDKKNSVLTFMRISEKTYEKYLRKYDREGKILYKAE